MMTEVALIKLPGVLFGPATEPDRGLLSTLKTGEVWRTRLARMRNGAFHRRFFALMQMVLENSDRHANLEELLTDVKLAVGHYAEHVTGDGELVYVPKSISFAHMDDTEFSRFYSRAIDAVLKHFMPDTDPDALEQAVLRVLDFC